MAAKPKLKKHEKEILNSFEEGEWKSVQNIAIDEGIPYQTLISSLIHKFVSGKLINKNRVS
ncbi:MAG: hypothetical protein ABUK01_12000 [Leptospirales bacterium]